MYEMEHDEDVDVETPGEGGQLQSVCGAVGGRLGWRGRREGVQRHQHGQPAQYEQHHRPPCQHIHTLTIQAQFSYLIQAHVSSSIIYMISK